MNVKECKEFFESISLDSQEINRSFIYDIFTKHKDQISKELFIKDNFKEITEDYAWDKDGIIKLNLGIIASNDKFFIQSSPDEAIKKILNLFTIKYKDRVNIFLQNVISQDAKIKIFDTEMIKFVYPFYEIILFIEEKDSYSFVCFGYSD